MLNAAMRTYCRLLAANPGPARALVVESVACPGDPQGTGRVPHGVGSADGGAGGRAPPRPAGTADGRYRRDRAVVHLLATAIEEGRDLSSMSGILADTAYRLLLA